MDLYAELDYKAAMRSRIAELNQDRRRVTLKKIAEKIPIQYTYLSRVMNDADRHLNEEHLFTMGSLLGFLPDELEYLSLLRAYQTATEPQRKRHLHDRISHLRNARKLNASVKGFDSTLLAREMAYLFDPLCVIVHVALNIVEYREDPRRLCGPLGIDRERLREILRSLHRTGFIELDERGTVTRLLDGHVHYGADHPLMRMHQTAMRNLSQGQDARTPAEAKTAFTVTFSADASTFGEVLTLFREFVKEVEKRVVKAPSRNAYQMNFDLFRWL